MSKIYNFEEFKKVAKVGMKFRVHYGDQDYSYEEIIGITDTEIKTDSPYYWYKNCAYPQPFEILSNDPCDNLKVGDVLLHPGSMDATVIEVMENLIAVNYGENEYSAYLIDRKKITKENGWTIKGSTPKEEKSGEEIIEEVIRIIDPTPIPARIGTGSAIQEIKEKIKLILK